MTATVVQNATPPTAHAARRLLDSRNLTEELVGAGGGSLYAVNVTGPLGDPVFSCFGMLDHLDPPTAVIEASAAGGRADIAWQTGPGGPMPTSWGVGELICAAMDEGAQRIVLIGRGSCLGDGGAGMARALGERMPCRNGRVLETDLGFLADRLGGRLREHDLLLDSCLQQPD